jgi:CRP-like cAMP-binding protein
LVDKQWPPGRDCVFMDTNARSQNGFLKSLSTDDFEALQPHLRTAKLSQGQVLQELGDPIDQVYFPHDCVLSRILELDAGHSVEIAMIGRDSILGALAATGVPAAKSGAVVVLAGIASVIDIERLRAAAERSTTLSKTLVRHGQAVLVRAQQAVGCKTLHPVEARLARWLLEARDMCGNNRLMLTQEMLGQMIGARHNSVAIVAHTFEQQGCITFGRGYVEIIDPGGLAEAACTCYATIKAQHGSLRQDVEQSFRCGEITH